MSHDTRGPHTRLTDAESALVTSTGHRPDNLQCLARGVRLQATTFTDRDFILLLDSTDEACWTGPDGTVVTCPDGLERMEVVGSLPTMPDHLWERYRDRLLDWAARDVELCFLALPGISLLVGEDHPLPLPCRPYPL